MNEAQLVVCLIHWTSASFSHELWDGMLFAFKRKVILVIVFAAGGLLSCLTFMMEIVGRNETSTVAGTSIARPGIPITILLVLCHCVHRNSPSQVYLAHPVLFIVTWGSAAAKITSKLMLAHMSCSEMDVLDPCFVGPVVMLLNQAMGCPIDEYRLLWVAFLYVWVDITLYSARICTAIY